MKLQLTILTTGGTIEKIYNERDGTLENRGSFVEDFISDHLRTPYLEIKVIQLMAKDSLEMTDKDRKKICQNVVQESEKKRPVLVLHGTDTLEKSVRYCKKETGIFLCRPVIFTGAMKPFGFRKSDALQNLTEAIALSQVLPVGVYLSFHSRLFEADNVRKNIGEGTFEMIFEK